MKKPPRIFISYAHEDNKKAIKIYQALQKEGLNPWKDSESIPGGAPWKMSIREAIHTSDFVVVLLSDSSIRNRRNFKYEIDESLALFDAKRRRKNFIVPVRISNCKVPKRLADRFQYVDLFGPSGWSKGWSKLLQSLKDEIGGRGSDDKISHITNRSAPSASSPELKIPSSLTTKPFAYPRPRWLTESQRSPLSEVAKAAFVLLLFDQTETGCWGKSYLPGHLSRGEILPRAMGALTGTPFALLAISSYAAGKKSETRTIGRTELLVHESTDNAVLATLDDLLQSDGSFLKEYTRSYTGTDPLQERPRHEAGACLIRMLYGQIDQRDLKTIERLCQPMIEPKTYDLAVVLRLFFQVHYVHSIPVSLRSKVTRTREKLLARLVREIQSARGASIAGKGDMRDESINQWSTAWYLLPLLTLPSIPSPVRAILTDRVRRFFLKRSAASPRETSLLPPQVDESLRGDGKSAFGSGLALVSWRVLETMEPKDLTRSKQAQKMVDRIVASTADVIEAPMFNPGPDKPEGYLGWGAICLGAASVGIRISYDDCHAAVTLTRQLNHEPVNRRSEKELERAYTRIIKKNKFVKPELAGYVARAAARLSFIYGPVRRARKKQLAREHKLEFS
jgi:hypothetical protein